MEYPLQASDLLTLYRQNGWVQTFAEAVKTVGSKNLQLKGLVGSVDAVLAAATYKLVPQTHLFILHDKEEAAYFYSDLQNLLEKQTIFFYPTSHKQPYTIEDPKNANVLMRAEILHRICRPNDNGALIVTYPEALSEKVPQKTSFEKNTCRIKVGDQCVISVLTDQLLQQGFEKTDFVYEVGQFAVRGGIIDIFSYAHQLPYRIELWGNEVESIRTFHPTNQLSLDKISQVAILADVTGQQAHVAYQSFLDFLPATTKVWLKDYEMILTTFDKAYQKAITTFGTMVAQSGDTQIIQSPTVLFETQESGEEALQRFTTIEFGYRYYLKPMKTFLYKASAQPAFNQNFEWLAENLHKNQSEGLENIMAAASASQFDRLATICEELDKAVKFKELNLGLRQGYVDNELGIACYTDHQLFDRYYRYRSPKKYSKTKAITLKEFQQLQPGDYVVHIDYGIGRFAGLDKLAVNGKQQEVVRLIYKDGDLVYLSVHSLHKISKYAGKEGLIPNMSKLGTSAWENKKKKVKKKVKDIAKDLIQLYAKRKQAPGFAFSKNSFLQAELESSFIYEDTPDQSTATADVKKDMELPHPMDRLVCGDVGFGKTEVAIRAAFKAINDGKQVAVLVPTTILALQHYHSFSNRLANFSVKIAYISRFKSAKAIKQVLQETIAGKVDILIGTHRILNKDKKFKDLGLLIIDEEQKFGVKAKERLKEIKVNVDVLTLTATPIPRTLHFSLMGARDLSIIATPPPNRQSVETTIHPFNKEVIRDAISYEIQRKGQVFFVHNRIANIEEIANMIYKLVPDCRISVAHGQMEGVKLEKTMLKFIEGAYNVLVSTNIIESGLDIPNANTIIINDAHMFGLSDLHQIRGRVGRSNKKAFCYLLAPPASSLTADARKRLSALEEFSHLGDGFKVAMRDLDIRGAGDLLGAAQSGFISDLGFDMYHKLLDEAVKELKQEEFKSLFEKELTQQIKDLVPDCTIETDLEILIPDTYVNNISERLNLYTKLDNIEDEASLKAFQHNLRDRFGPLPQSVKELTKTVKLRWAAKKLGFEKIILKNDVMKCYFASEDKSYFHSGIFEKILAYIQQHPTRYALKETTRNLILIADHVKSITQAQEVLDTMATAEIVTT
ncbi:MAG: transcription-repair coupling factor [Cytophagales bacterium]|nr:transcription-repair coupling factor [Cytophagales bacterium]